MALGARFREVGVETFAGTRKLVELAVEAVALVVVAGLIVIKAGLVDWERQMRRRDACH